MLRDFGMGLKGGGWSGDIWVAGWESVVGHERCFECGRGGQYDGCYRVFDSTPTPHNWPRCPVALILFQDFAHISDI